MRSARCHRSLKCRSVSLSEKWAIRPQIGWVIRVQEWAEIRHLHFSEGLSARAIAARLGLARDTVSRALRMESPPRYCRAPAGSAFDAVEAGVRVLLARFPSMLRRCG